MPGADGEAGNLPAPASGLGPYRFIIRAADTDWQDFLHPAALFSLMQEAAYYNAEALGMGSGTLDDRGLCWILVRVSVRLENMPRWSETITVDTWSRGAQRLVFQRDFEFFSQDGGKFGCASTEWLAVSQDTHKIAKPEDAFEKMPPSIRSRQACPVRRPPALREEFLQRPVRVFHADYSDIDRNRHVSNTRYVSWCLDAAAACEGTGSLPAFSVREIDIHYVNEVFCGTEICCYCQREQDGTDLRYLVEARAAGGQPIFRCSMTLAAC